MYKQYTVANEDAFHHERYPNIIDELEEIGRKTTRMPGDSKGEIVISFLKDHSIAINWIRKNPKLVKFITSRSVSTSHLESLFESCRGNHSFLSEFEAFVRQKIQ